MKKVVKFLYVALIVLLSMAACGSKDAGIIDPNYSAPLGIDTGYYKILDYRAGKVPEIHMGESSLGFHDYAPEKDTFYVWQWNSKGIAGMDTREGSKTGIPVVRKYDTKGKLLWTKSYDLPFEDMGAGKLAACSDGFVLAVEKWPYSSGEQMVYSKSYVLRCDKDGNILWQKEIENYSGEMFRNIFITDKQDIITVGSWRYAGGEQVKDAANDIVLMKFNEKGDILVQKSFGGSDFENLSAAVYSKDIGIIVNYYAQSGGASMNMLTCFDEGLNEKWSYQAKEKEFLDSDKLTVSNGFIYQAGVKYSETVGGPQENFLMKLDKTGKIVWCDRNKSRVITAVAALSNGNVAVAGIDGKDNYIRIIDPDNHTLHQVTGNSNAERPAIYPTDDGGFIAVAVRNIKTVPQPVYISSIWYDSETMASRFDKNLKLIWRKTYDKYKDVMKFDFVQPTRDGRLLLE